MNPDRVRSIIIGSYLGDGTIAKPQTKNSQCYLKIQHSIKQADYIYWKQQLLPNFFSKPLIVNRKFKGEDYTSIATTTKVHPFCTKLRSLYVDGKKTLKDSIFKDFDELGLAIWYMDDGNLSWRRKTRKDGSSYKYIGGIKIATCSFTEQECNILIDLLKRKWNLNSKIYWTKGKYPTLWLNSENAKLFIEIVKPFVPDCMEYKINIQRETPK